MNARKVLLSLGLCAVLAVVSGIVYADEQGMPTNDSSGYWPSSEPYAPAGQQPDAAEIREPVDTGAVPNMPEGLTEERCCGGQSEPKEEIGTNVYRHGLDDGP